MQTIVRLIAFLSCLTSIVQFKREKKTNIRMEMKQHENENWWITLATIRINIRKFMVDPEHKFIQHVFQIYIYIRTQFHLILCKSICYPFNLCDYKQLLWLSNVYTSMIHFMCPRTNPQHHTTTTHINTFEMCTTRNDDEQF